MLTCVSVQAALLVARTRYIRCKLSSTLLHRSASRSHQAFHFFSEEKKKYPLRLGRWRMRREIPHSSAHQSSGQSTSPPSSRFGSTAQGSFSSSTGTKGQIDLHCTRTTLQSLHSKKSVLRGGGPSAATRPVTSRDLPASPSSQSQPKYTLHAVHAATQLDSFSSVVER